MGYSKWYSNIFQICGLFQNYSNKLAHYSIEYPEYDGSIMAGGWLYHITHRIYWNYWNHNGFLNNPFGYSRSSVLQITRFFHHVKKIQLNPTSLPDYSMALFQMIPTHYSIMVGSIQNLPNVSIPCNQAEAQAAALRRRAQAELRQALRGLLQRGILDGIFRYLVQYSINGAVIYIYICYMKCATIYKYYRHPSCNSYI